MFAVALALAVVAACGSSADTGELAQDPQCPASLPAPTGSCEVLDLECGYMGSACQQTATCASGFWQVSACESDEATCTMVDHGVGCTGLVTPCPYWGLDCYSTCEWVCSEGEWELSCPDC